MAKGWKNFATINGEEIIDRKTRVRNDKGFENLIKNTKTMSVKELKDEAETLYLQKTWEEDKLITNYNEKKLKSKEAIKQAKKIIKFRAKEKENTPKVENIPVDSSNAEVEV